MEDTKSLLIMVLQKIFHNRLKVVEDTYKIIYNYNNGKKEKREYETTLRNICDLMNEELPSDILVYLLTLVDMPNEDGTQLPIMKKIQKTYSCLAESVRPFLLEYLANKKSSDIDLVKTEEHTTKKIIKINVSENKINKEISYHKSTNSKAYNQSAIDGVNIKCLKPVIKRNKRKPIGHNQESANSLLSITASYVINNEKKLKYMYKSKLIKAWEIINSNCYSRDTLKQCYNTLEHVNKKAKLLRSIENDTVAEILMEEYGNSNILLNECILFSRANLNPFQFNKFLIDRLESVINY